jgi:competence ComEA-like helix-hairpin-helix protein
MYGFARRFLFSIVCLWLPNGDLSARTPWLKLQDCRYIVNSANDGDSFYVQGAGNKYIFRLYFVDAPETEAALADRLDEQAAYFGVTPAQAIKIGEEARRFTREKLSGGFTVRTCMQNALGQSGAERFYAFIQTNAGDLGELLVENGLARVYGSEAKPEGLRNSEQQLIRLERLQREAKTNKRGAWGITEGGLNRRAPSHKKKEDDEWFERFFDPENFVRPETRPEEAGPSPTSSPAPSPESNDSDNVKLDINNATEAELKNIPGIGPKMAMEIISARPFKSADELRKVPGIGPKKYAKFRPYFK